MNRRTPHADVPTAGRPATRAPKAPRNVAVIGPGAMASAVIHGLVSKGWTDAKHVIGVHPKKDRAADIAKRLGVKVVTSIAEGTKGADVLLLGVKPQILPDILAELKGKLAPSTLVVSLAAGFPTKRIESALPRNPVVRTMPNLACTVGEGATAMCAGTHATKEHLVTARSMFEAVGVVEEVPEKLMDAVTGLSGTGPMYVFHLVEALADAGVKVGLSRDAASRLALQTVIGSARLAAASHLHPAALKDSVTSPGGTAIAALHVLRREGFQAILMDAVEAAAKRSAELGQAN